MNGFLYEIFQWSFQPQNLFKFCCRMFIVHRTLTKPGNFDVGVQAGPNVQKLKGNLKVMYVF